MGYASRSTQPAQSWGTAENGEIPDRAWHSCVRPVIQRFVDLCQTCQETRGRKSTHKNIHKPIIPDTVGQRGQADLVDLQMVPDGGYKYILNYQDCFSKFVILRALKTKTAAEVADCLVNIFFEHGPPSLLQTDNGAEFSNKLLMARIKQLWTGTVIVHGRPRHPQDQGSVERANGDFKNMLYARLRDVKKELNQGSVSYLMCSILRIMLITVVSAPPHIVCTLGGHPPT